MSRYEDSPRGLSFEFKLSILGLLLSIIALFFVMSFNPVQPGEVKVVSEFGRLTGRVLTEGANWTAPWQGVKEYSIQVKTYETSAHPESSQADYTDYTVSAQTIDGQQVQISYTVKFKIDQENVIAVLRDVGDMKTIVENVVKADSRSSARKIAQLYQAESLYSGEGIQEFEDHVQSAINESYDSLGVTLVDLLIRKVDFDEDYVAAIERQQIEQERIETEDYAAQAAVYEARKIAELAKGEAQADIERANGTAQAKIINAEADARAVVIAAEAEAEAIELKGAALRDYPEVLQLTFIDQLSGVQWGFLPNDGIAALLPLDSLVK